MSVYVSLCQTPNREEKHWIVVPLATQRLISKSRTPNHFYNHLLCFLHFYLKSLHQVIKTLRLMFVVF